MFKMLTIKSYIIYFSDFMIAGSSRFWSKKLYLTYVRKTRKGTSFVYIYKKLV